MINKDSIVTAYDEHLTLVEWLQKVEKALEGASAVSFNVNKRGDATLTFSVVFEDGSEIESSPIVLEQGESVNEATIHNGHLILTLTNGDELDAGDLGGVSGFNIDASQHLIVTYQNGSTQDLGAIFNGNVVINGALSTPILTSANDHIEAKKPVIETMTGYGFFLNPSLTNVSVEIIYAGVCKNGNKLTLTIFGKLTNETANEINLANFLAPSSILSKLYPYVVQGENVLAQKEVEFYPSANHSVLPLKAVFETAKSNTAIIINVRKLNELTAGVEYFFRFEQTFLLSDNLAE